MLSSIPRRIRRVRWLPQVLYGLPLVLGCQGSELAPHPPDIETLFWDLRLDHQAVTLSTTPPYNTLTLTATPRNHASEPLKGLPAPVYTTSNPRSVVVTAEGKIQAGPQGGLATVTATLTVANVKHADTVYVLVVDNPAPPVLDRVSIHPLPPDSAKRAVSGIRVGPVVASTTNTFPRMIKLEETDVPGGSFLQGFHPIYPFPVRTTDLGNNPISGLVHLESADATIATFYDNDKARPSFTVFLPFESALSSPWIQPQKSGVVTIYASATMFGVTKADTLQYHVGWPLATGIVAAPLPLRGPGNFFLKYIPGKLTKAASAPVRIGTGGVVAWRGESTEETEVVFDDPTHVRAYETLSASLLNPALCDPSNISFYPVGGCAAAGNFVLPPVTIVEGMTIYSYAYRVFRVPGVYNFHNARNGVRSQVVVGD